MRTDKFTMLPETVRLDERTSVIDYGVYGTLVAYMNNETRQCYPSVSTIAKETKVSESSVRKSLQRLEEFGYIHIYREKKSDGRNKPNLYTILDASKIEIESVRARDNEGESKAPTFQELQAIQDKKAPKKKLIKKVAKEVENKKPTIKKVTKEVEETKIVETEEEKKLPMHDRALLRVERESDKAIEDLMIKTGVTTYDDLEVVAKIEFNKIMSNYSRDIGLIHLNTKIETDLGVRLTREEIEILDAISPENYTPILKAIEYTKDKLRSVDAPVRYLTHMAKIFTNKINVKEVV